LESRGFDHGSHKIYYAGFPYNVNPNGGVNNAKIIPLLLVKTIKLLAPLFWAILEFKTLPKRIYGQANPYHQPTAYPVQVLF
jgi:hypothetical protein